MTWCELKWAAWVTISASSRPHRIRISHTADCSEPKRSHAIRRVGSCPAGETVTDRTGEFYLITSVQCSQQHDSSCRGTIDVPIFGFQSVRTKESETERQHSINSSVVSEMTLKIKTGERGGCDTCTQTTPWLLLFPVVTVWELPTATHSASLLIWYTTIWNGRHFISHLFLR